ncbi:MAG: hypothetical protein A2Y07_11445 [Planctomycetes bacterium GWF2_50_10]|nr:MAG: hypothetical protein A2Y07_11445 [Planctomycetes bacterium GWF2_50_10]
MITTVVFDLDDTLYNEIDYCRSGFQAVSSYLSAKPSYPPSATIFDAIWTQFSAGNYGYAFNAALDNLKLPCNQQIINELIEVYRNHKPALQLPALSRQILDNLKPKFNLALLTDGFMPAQRLKVEALGIQSYFGCIIYTEELGRQFWKPSPAGFERIVAHFTVDPATCVYIGDNPIKDFIAPNQLGFTTIQLISPDAIHKLTAPHPSAHPAHTIKSLAQLEYLLDRLNVSA